MEVVRWIMIVRYDYGRHVHYISKANVIHFWKVSRRMPGPSLHRFLLRRTNTPHTVFPSGAGSVLQQRGRDQDVSSPPILPDLWGRRSLPHSPLHIIVHCHGLLGSMHHRSHRRLPSRVQELGQIGPWGMHRRNQFLPLEWDM